MKRSFIYIGFIILSTWSSPVYAQQFADEIKTFRKADSISIPYAGQHPIVFAGSSSFRLWKNMEAAFAGYPVINRGFGGSFLTDVIHYANDVILKYKPKQVVIYCGENDLASADSITAEIVFERFKKLFNITRKEFPKVAIAYVSIKPSPSRIKIQSKVIEANRLIKKFLIKYKRTAFIDVYTLMLNADGSIRSELFLEDNLHMNEKGYEIWRQSIQSYLLR